MSADPYLYGILAREAVDAGLYSPVQPPLSGPRKMLVQYGNWRLI